jgi:cobalamin biosynthesis protein CobC
MFDSFGVQASRGDGTVDLRFHGGNLAAAERRFGRPEAGWLDLSTGINPNPFPFSVPDRSYWSQLPGEEEIASLCRAAAGFYGVSEGAAIVPAPGVQALIQVLPHLRKSSRVAVFGPTYTEHAWAWTAAGHEVHILDGNRIEKWENVLAKVDVAILVNPNNPDGRKIGPDALLALSQGLLERGGWLVVDEAFADVTPGISLAGHVGLPGLVVLRSFGKFFGLAGVRLGFALLWADLEGALYQGLGLWAVSGPAIAVGQKALNDKAWAEKTRASLDRDRERLDRILSAAELEILGGTSLFRLVKTQRARKLYDYLGGAGILVRFFSEHPHWLRFGLPGKEEEFERLKAALIDWRSR